MTVQEERAELPDDVWEVISGIEDAVLSIIPAAPFTTTLLRQNVKIAEELGEVARALTRAIAASEGKGDRKKFWDGVVAELSDVIISSMVMISMIHESPVDAFGENLLRAAQRYGVSP